MSGRSSPWVVSDFFTKNGINRTYSNQDAASTSSDRGAAGAQSRAARGIKRKQNSSSSEPKLSRKSSFAKSASFEEATRDRDVLWSAKHAPTSADQLALHPKKVQEVRRWLEAYLSRGADDAGAMSPFLLLSGPSGSGKSATARAVASDLRMDLREWTNPLDSGESEEQRLVDEALRGDDFREDRPTFRASQVTLFREFVSRANKYRQLQIGVSDSSSSSSSFSSPLLLIDEFPNSFLRDSTVFHDLLTSYSRLRRPAPIVFVVSDSKSSSDSILLKLFPKDLQSRLDFSLINFNAVANTFLLSCLKRIGQREAASDSRFVAVASAVLDGIVADAGGDLRVAINNFQFRSLRVATSIGRESKPSTSKETKSFSSKGVKGKKNSFGSKSSINSQKDSHLFLFHALGKILHCKRDPAASADEVKPLPPHLMQQRRDPLRCVPEEVVERTAVSSEFFNLFLHQNYPDFFSRVEDVADVADHLSLVDALSPEWSVKSFAQGYESSIAARALLFFNSEKSTSGGGGGFGVGFRPMKKPRWFDASRTTRERLANCVALFRGFGETLPNLTTTTLPALKAMRRTPPVAAQTELVRDLTTFERILTTKSGELLKESEVVDDEDKDVVQLTHFDGETAPEDNTLSQYDDDLVEIEEFD